MKPRYFAFAVVEAETMRDAVEAIRTEMDARLREIDEKYTRDVQDDATLDAMLDALVAASGQHAVVRAGAGLRMDVKRGVPADAAAQLRDWARQVEEWPE